MSGPTKLFCVLMMGCGPTTPSTTEPGPRDSADPTPADSAPVVPTGTPVDSTPPVDDVVLAFIGDQGLESADGEVDGARAVLRLIRAEGADAVLHQGDFDYADDPDAWIRQIDEELGSELPYFVSVGNHDEARWDTEGGYREIMEARARRLGFDWTGTYGESAALDFRGIKILLGAPGTIDAEDGFYEAFYDRELAADSSVWRICSWHKNQRLMQVGGKGDSTGWGVYEACRRGGAIIATGHEHSYSRTHPLSSMSEQVVASRSDALTIRPGVSFAFVSGLAGASIRGQELEGDWWASVYTSDQGATYGALFGVFHDGGQGAEAEFYFKNIRGEVVDSFTVTSEVGSR